MVTSFIIKLKKLWTGPDLPWGKVGQLPQGPHQKGAPTTKKNVPFKYIFKWCVFLCGEASPLMEAPIRKKTPFWWGPTPETYHSNTYWNSTFFFGGASS